MTCNSIDAVQLELFANRFVAAASEMGEMLRRTAISTNVKERLDFSCGILDPQGELVVNAPHIPVHLGALGLCVRGVRSAVKMLPGDVVVTNHPAHGGTHLPDITVVTPVFIGNSNALLAYVASRAHHAEIGGIRPASMPHDATCLAEEGVVIPPTHVVRNGKVDWDVVKSLLKGGPFPSRAVEENIADLRAAVAANHRGVVVLTEMAVEFGAETILQHMAAMKEQARLAIVDALTDFDDGEYGATQFLDDGSVLKVNIKIDGGTAEMDFSGTSDVHPGSLNATPAIVQSVVLYVLRLLCRKPLPLNEGMLGSVKLIIPSGILNPDFSVDPSDAPAICGGNVETSQRLVDTLLKALHVQACSQGTMNNVAFGTGDFSYFETICGGAGAGPDYDGADAVHTHMTNTRMTDPEILEHRCPVRVEKFEVRPGSGGKGKQCGGNGATRELLFLRNSSLSIMGQHRSAGPYGMEGGEPGLPGSQKIIRANGEVEPLKEIDGTDVAPGDRLIIETPGGGGWGEK